MTCHYVRFTRAEFIPSTRLLRPFVSLRQRLDCGQYLAYNTGVTEMGE